MNNYQILILIAAALMNVVTSAIVVYAGYCLVRFGDLRRALEQSIQDGDGVYHWKDAKSFSFLLSGYLAAWFTMNLAFIFCYERMFNVEPMLFLTLFCGIVFTLWGIAWRKPN